VEGTGCGGVGHREQGARKMVRGRENTTGGSLLGIREKRVDVSDDNLPMDGVFDAHLNQFHEFIKCWGV
jgi:hypothetical protein